MSLHRDPKPTTVIDVQVGWAEQRSTLPDRYLLISFGMYLPRPVFTATAHDDCHLYSVHAASSAQRHLPRPPCKVKTLCISLALVEWHCSSIKKINAPDTWTRPPWNGFRASAILLWTADPDQLADCPSTTVCTATEGCRLNSDPMRHSRPLSPSSLLPLMISSCGGQNENQS